MAANYKVAQKFDEARSYKCWKNEVNMWTGVTELEKKKQALAVALGLEGRAKKIAIEISGDELDNDNGMDKIIREAGRRFSARGKGSGV